MAKSNDSGGGGVLIIAGVGLLALSVYRNVIKPKILVPIAVRKYIDNIRISLPQVKIRKDSVDFTIRLQNPNPTPMSIQALVGNVLIATNQGETVFNLGAVNKYGNTIIQPEGETIVPFSIKMKALPLLEYLSQLMAGQVHGQVLHFRGNITIDNRVYPANTSFAIA